MHNTLRNQITCAWFAIGASSVALAQPGYHSYFLYQGNDHPNEAENYWSEEAQGLAHDDDHWYLTSALDLWRVPVGEDLAREEPSANVRLKRIQDTPLGAQGYDHYGDLELFVRDGRKYLFIPVTGGPCPAIAVFEPDTLVYIDHVCVQTASWVALDPAGRLYVCDGRLYRYDVDWVALAGGSLVLSNRTDITLADSNGATLLWTAQQGGAFSSDGELLYISTGFPTVSPEHDGIHVFDTGSWRRIRKSSDGEMPFNFSYTTGVESEEPEGLTIWDLNDGRAPGMRGELHVILLDNDFPSDDDVFIKSYSAIIHVNRSHSGPETGRSNEPFNTLSEALDAAWNGARLRLRAQTYPGARTLNKRIRLEASGGVARIGG